jgi:periplasmic protein CpxP/Spy
MTNSLARSAGPEPRQEPSTLRYRSLLGSWKVWVGLAAVALIAAAFNWSWLVAAGAVPLLVGLLPCLAMCALSLCSHKNAGAGCEAQRQEASAPSRAHRHRREQIRTARCAAGNAACSRASQFPHSPIPNQEKSHMSKITTLSFAVLAVAMGLILSPALRAQETPGSGAAVSPGMSDHGRMMGHDMSGMMKMMGQMSQMMDQCSRMMQSMNDRQAPKTPDQPSK